MFSQRQIIIQNLAYSGTENRQIFHKLDLVLGNLKTGIVGRNGIGKTTLLKLIMGELIPTTGSVTANCRLGYCPQDLSIYHNKTIAQFFGVDAKIAALDNILNGDYSDHDLTTLADDWQVKERIFSLLNRATLKTRDLHSKLASLSNGEITKLYLANLFHGEPSADFLLLDEPTNNLDGEAREMLYKMIQLTTKGILVVSHDETILELMDQILAIANQGIKLYGGNFNFYQTQRDIERRAKEQKFITAKKQLNEAMVSIQTTKEKHQQNQTQGKLLRKKGGDPKGAMDFFKNRSGRTQSTIGKRATRLVKTAEEQLSQAKQALHEKYELNIKLPNTFLAKDKMVAMLDRVTFGYDNTLPSLIHSFSLTVKGPEKIAIRGPNGSGKTTLAKLINQTLVPREGSVQLMVKPNYLDQNLELLDPNLSIIDNYGKLNPKISINGTHDNLAQFLFRNEMVTTKIRDLSYGEKIRLALATVLLAEQPPQLLILDEPNNHLDLENLATLISILKRYQGALIIISHDEKFIKQLNITETIVTPLISTK